MTDDEAKGGPKTLLVVQVPIKEGQEYPIIGIWTDNYNYTVGTKQTEDQKHIGTPCYPGNLAQALQRLSEKIFKEKLKVANEDEVEMTLENLTEMVEEHDDYMKDLAAGL